MSYAKSKLSRERFSNFPKRQHKVSHCDWLWLNKTNQNRIFYIHLQNRIEQNNLLRLRVLRLVLTDVDRLSPILIKLILFVYSISWRSWAHHLNYMSVLWEEIEIKIQLLAVLRIKEEICSNHVERIWSMF